MTRQGSFSHRVRLLTTLVADSALSAGALALAVLLRRNVPLPATVSLLPPAKFPLDTVNVVFAVGTFLVALAMAGFYDARQSARHRPLLVAALLIQVALLSIGAVFLQRPYPRTILLAVPLLEAAAFHPLRHLLGRTFRRRGRQTLLVAAAAEVEPFVREVADIVDERFEIVGVVSPSPVGERVPYHGALHEDAASAAIRSVEEVVFIGGENDAAARLRLLLLRGPLGFLLVHSTADALLTAPTLAWIGDKPVVEIAARAGYGSGRIIKRAFDILGSLLLGALTLPLMIAAAAAILLDDGLPVLIAQERAGIEGRLFRMWKFRTIRRSGDRRPEDLVGENSGRVTRTGYWLRRHRIDELPQLMNVLRAEMSLVGPRPERLELVDPISRDVEGFALRHLVKPGIAGLAQVRADYETPPRTKLRYDLTYICGWSLALDVRLLFGAISAALAGRGR